MPTRTTPTSSNSAPCHTIRAARLSLEVSRLSAEFAHGLAHEPRFILTASACRISYELGAAADALGSLLTSEG